jgi:hypothetical protein
MCKSCSTIGIKERRVTTMGYEAPRRAGAAGEVRQHGNDLSAYLMTKVWGRAIKACFGIACG